MTKIRNPNPVCQAFRRSEENAAVLAVKRAEIWIGASECIQIFRYSVNFLPPINVGKNYNPLYIEFFLYIGDWAFSHQNRYLKNYLNN